MTGEKIVYADRPDTGERVAVHYRTFAPKWIYFGDLGDGLRPVATSMAATATPTSMALAGDRIDVTPAPAYTIKKAAAA